MTTRAFLMAALLFGVMSLVVVISARRLVHAALQLDSAKLAFEQTTRDTQEVVELRGREERIGLAERPTQDVIAQVNAVLAQVGVPTQRLKNLSPESDTAMNLGTERPGSGGGGSAQYRRQSLRLVLEDLSVQEVGSFLAEWQKSPGGKIWTPNRIELTHSRSGGGGKELGRYDLTILITAMYVSQTKESS